MKLLKSLITISLFAVSLQSYADTSFSFFMETAKQAEAGDYLLMTYEDYAVLAALRNENWVYTALSIDNRNAIDAEMTGLKIQSVQILRPVNQERIGDDFKQWLNAKTQGK